MVPSTHHRSKRVSWTSKKIQMASLNHSRYLRGKMKWFKAIPSTLIESSSHRQQPKLWIGIMMMLRIISSHVPCPCSSKSAQPELTSHWTSQTWRSSTRSRIRDRLSLRRLHLTRWHQATPGSSRSSLRNNKRTQLRPRTCDMKRIIRRQSSRITSN